MRIDRLLDKIATAFRFSFEIGVLFSEVLVEMTIDVNAIFLTRTRQTVSHLKSEYTHLVDNDMKLLAEQIDKHTTLNHADIEEILGQLDEYKSHKNVSNTEVEYSIKSFVTRRVKEKAKRGGRRRKSRTHKRTLRKHKRNHRRTHRR